MKRKFVFPKFSLVAFIIGVVMIGFWHIVNKLEEMNYYFCFGTLNTERLYFIIFCIGTAFLICSLAWLMFKNIKWKWVSILISVVLALFAVWYLGLMSWSMNISDTEFLKFTSADGEHSIMIMENSFLHGGIGDVFEKTSNITMKKVGDYSFNHVFNPVNKGEFFFVWNEENFELHYKAYDSGEYKVLEMEYVK